METSRVNDMDSGGLEPLRLEAFLPYRLNVLAAMVSEGLARVYSERFDIDIPGWRTLATIGQFGPVSAKHIGAHSRMHKTKVSRAVAQLEARGYLRRTSNPDDKREAILALTDAGSRVYREIVPLALAYERRLLSMLSAEDARRVNGLIDSLSAGATGPGRGDASV